MEEVVLEEELYLDNQREDQEQQIKVSQEEVMVQMMLLEAEVAQVQAVMAEVAHLVDQEELVYQIILQVLVYLEQAAVEEDVLAQAVMAEAVQVLIVLEQHQVQLTQVVEAEHFIMVEAQVLEVKEL